MSIDHVALITQSGVYTHHQFNPILLIDDPDYPPTRLWQGMINEKP